MLIAPSGPTCCSGMRVPGRPLVVDCCKSSCSSREGAPGVPRDVLARVDVDVDASVGADPNGVVCWFANALSPSAAAPSSEAAPPASVCAAVPAGGSLRPTVDDGARLLIELCSAVPPSNCDINSREAVLGLCPALSSAPVPRVGAPNNRLVTPGDTDSSVSELPNSPFAAASQMTTETVSPTSILTSGGGVYFLNRSWKAGSPCARRTLTTASSSLTTSKAILSPSLAWETISLPEDGPSLDAIEHPP